MKKNKRSLFMISALSVAGLSFAALFCFSGLASTLKALLTLLGTLGLIAALVYFIRSIAALIRTSSFRQAYEGYLLNGIAALLCVCTVIPLIHYCWPFAIPVQLEEVAQIRVREDISRPAEESWYCVYDLRGKGSPSSWNGLPTFRIEGRYPVMDLTQYTYLISFERQVESLSYQVWDSKGPVIVDFGHSVKWGNARLSEEITEQTIFIYRFPKKAIDNIHAVSYD